MPVTLEPIGAFGLTSDFWNLPAVTAEGKPIDYFTFSGWWHAKPTWDVRALTHWELVALHPVSGVPATEHVLCLVRIQEDDLPTEGGSREQVPPAFPEDISNHLGFSPDQLEALIAWLRSRGVPSDSSFDGGRIFEPWDIEAHIPQSHRSTLERFSQEVPSKLITWWCSGAKPLISRCGGLLGGWETTRPGQVWSLLIVRIAEHVEQVRHGVE